MCKAKQQAVNYIMKKLDNIKLEIYNINKYHTTDMLLYDFEKDLRIVNHRNIKIIKEKEKEEKDENLIDQLKNYLIEIKMIPINKILQESKKVIFYDECIYALREMNISKSKIIKCRTSNLIEEYDKGKETGLVNTKSGNIEEYKLNQDKEFNEFNIECKEGMSHRNILGGITTISNLVNRKEDNLMNIKEDNLVSRKEDNLVSRKEDNLMDDNIAKYINPQQDIQIYKKRKIIQYCDPLEKYKKMVYQILNGEIQAYFIIKSMHLPSLINTHMKNSLNTCMFLKRNEVEITLENTSHSDFISKYKEYLLIYKKCKSATSLYYKFAKTINSTSIHLSIKKISEKFGNLSVRETFKNRKPTENEVYANSCLDNLIQENNYFSVPIPTYSNVEYIETVNCERFILYPFLSEEDN